MNYKERTTEVLSVHGSKDAVRLTIEDNGCGDTTVSLYGGYDLTINGMKTLSSWLSKNLPELIEEHQELKDTAPEQEIRRLRNAIKTHRERVGSTIYTANDSLLWNSLNEAEEAHHGLTGE